MRCSGGLTRLVSIQDRTASPTKQMPQQTPGSKPVEPAIQPNADFARCFLRLANLPNFALDRLSLYEATLWRQAGRILFALDALDRRKPQERLRRFRIRSKLEPEDWHIPVLDRLYQNHLTRAVFNIAGNKFTATSSTMSLSGSPNVGRCFVSERHF